MSDCKYKGHAGNMSYHLRHALLSALQAFAENNGWDEDKWQATERKLVREFTATTPPRQYITALADGELYGNWPWLIQGSK